MARAKIGLVTAWFERGSGYVSRTYRRLLEPYADVAIYARGGQRDAQWDADGNVFRQGFHGGVNGTGIDLPTFETWLETEGIDLLIFNEQQDPEILYYVAGRLPLIAYVDYYRPDTLGIFELYDTLLCHTQRHAEAFSWHRAFRFFPWCGFPDDSEVTPADGAPVFIHNAGWLGINGRKGTLEALTAFQQVSDEDARLAIFSQVDAQCLPVWMRESVDADGRIAWRHGTYPPPGPYSEGNVYLYPARLDGIGLTVLEAMAAGRAVIAPSVAPYTDLVQPGRTGALVRTCSSRIREDGYYWPERGVDVAHLTDVMMEYANDPERVRHEGRMASEMVRAERSWACYGEHFADAVLETLTRFQHSARSSAGRRARPQQIAARYQRPAPVPSDFYGLWRALIRELEGREIRSACLVVDRPDDGLWIRKALQECCGVETFDLAIADVGVVDSLRNQLPYKRIFQETHGCRIDEEPFNGREHLWDIIVVWREASDTEELEVAKRLCRVLVAATEFAYSRERSVLKESGYRLLPSATSVAVHQLGRIGVFEVDAPVSDDFACG